MKKKLIWLVVAAIVILGGVYFYTTQNGSKQDENVIKIGAILPFSGDLASYGEPLKIGMELYQTENNKIKLIFEDSKGTQKDAINALNKLINIDKVDYFIGDVVSQNTLSMVPLIEKNNKFLMSPGASSPKLNGISPNFARNYPSSNEESNVSAEYAYSQGKRNALVVYVNTEFGIGLNEYFSKKFKKLGGNVVSIDYAEATKDFKNIIAKTKTMKYDVIYLAGNQMEMGNFIRQFKQLSNNKMLVISNISFLEKTCLKVAGVYAEGVIVPTASYNPNDTTESGIKHFTELFFRKYNSAPTIVNAVGYDAVAIIAKAISENGNDTKKVANYIRNLKNYNGALGVLNFSDGDVSFPMQFNVVNKDGTISIIN